MQRTVMNDYLEKNKQDLLPWVKDWSDPQNHIRYSNNVKELDYWDWFWCHPTAYQIIKCGLYGVPLTMTLSTLTFVAVKKGLLTGTSLVLLILSAVLVAGLIHTYNDLKKNKEMTIYDLYLREY